MIRSWFSRLLLAFVLLVVWPAASVRADAVSEARKLDETAKSEVRAGNWEMALVYFKMAYDVLSSSGFLLSMANCEYQLGQLKEALEHYQGYLTATEKQGTREEARTMSEAIDLARMRIKAINQRKSVLAISTAPPGADVHIEGPATLNDRAPTEFRVPRGRYKLTVSKQNYVPQTLDLDVDVATAKSLVFSLSPIPGRLEIRTIPPGATLYVRGNRAQNPYLQQVEPGSYEIYAEATDYKPRREVVQVTAGARSVVPFALDYVQRSGRPELITFWTTAGAIAFSTAVLARVETLKNPASGTLAIAGGIAGGIGGALVSRAFVPDYIRDNLALFRIGNSWIGALEGATIGLAATGRLSLPAAWIGGATGLAAGALVGVRLEDKAPNYGRVALIQSAAAIGALAGALAVPALKPKDSTGSIETVRPDYVDHYEPLGILAGLNLGLAAGLALAYLPDQREYGPTWQRVALIDLGVAAGAFVGAVATTLDCLGKPEQNCGFASNRLTPRFTLAGGAAGLVAAWFLTRDLDRSNETPSERHSLGFLPLPTVLAVPGADGRSRAVPGVAAQGRF
jgi:hypothetical protein